MELKDSQKKKADIARRPELDVILVSLTWGILLVHICMSYSPFINLVKYPELDKGPIKEDAFTIISAEYIIGLSENFMFAFAMPMFFYISGKGECQIKFSLRNVIVQINIQVNCCRPQHLLRLVPKNRDPVPRRASSPPPCPSPVS